MERMELSVTWFMCIFFSCLCVYACDTAKLLIFSTKSYKYPQHLALSHSLPLARALFFTYTKLNSILLNINRFSL